MPIVVSVLWFRTQPSAKDNPGQRASQNPLVAVFKIKGSMKNSGSPRMADADKRETRSFKKRSFGTAFFFLVAWHSAIPFGTPILLKRLL